MDSPVPIDDSALDTTTGDVTSPQAAQPGSSVLSPLSPTSPTSDTEHDGTNNLLKRITKLTILNCEGKFTQFMQEVSNESSI